MKSEITLRDITPIDEFTREDYMRFLAQGIYCINGLLNARDDPLTEREE